MMRRDFTLNSSTEIDLRAETACCGGGEKVDEKDLRTDTELRVIKD